MFRKGTIQDPDIVAVHSVSEVYEADLITGLLINSGIPAYYRDREESGGYLRIIGLGTPFGMDIYVNRKDAEKAKSLIDSYLSREEELTDEELAQIALQFREDSGQEE